MPVKPVVKKQNGVQISFRLSDEQAKVVDAIAGRVLPGIKLSRTQVINHFITTGIVRYDKEVASVQGDDSTGESDDA